MKSQLSYYSNSPVTATQRDRDRPRTSISSTRLALDIFDKLRRSSSQHLISSHRNEYIILDSHPNFLPILDYLKAGE